MVGVSSAVRKCKAENPLQTVRRRPHSSVCSDSEKKVKSGKKVAGIGTIRIPRIKREGDYRSVLSAESF
jgi:hypothetical protein